MEKCIWIGELVLSTGVCIRAISFYFADNVIKDMLTYLNS